MSWLNEISRDYKYKCDQCKNVFIRSSTLGYPACKEPQPCECGGSGSYDGFLPFKLNIRGKVAYEQNGRKAYAVTDGNGNVRYVSATKEHYYNTGDIVPQYTDKYKDHLRHTRNDHHMEEFKHSDLVKERNQALKAMERVQVAKDSQIKEDSNEI